MDFLVTKFGKTVAYHSTNMACPIFGYKQNASIEDTINYLNDNFECPSYAFDDSITCDIKPTREVTKKDKIIKNVAELKLLSSLNSLLKKNKGISR